MIQLDLIPTFCGLVAAVSWGVADFFAAKASRKISPVLASIFIAAGSALLYSLFYMFYPESSIPWTQSGIVYASIAGLFMGAGLLMFYYGLEKGPVSIVSPIGSAYPLVTTLLVLTFLHGSLTGWQITGIFLVIGGITATSGLLTAKKSEKKLTSGVLYALLTFVLWGISFAFLGEAVARLGWEKATLLDIWLELLAILCLAPFLEKRQHFLVNPIKIFKNPLIAGAALIQVVGLAVFNIGLTKTSSTAIITAISATYPALTILLAVHHFKEKTSVIALSGAAITVTGVILLSLV